MSGRQRVGRVQDAEPSTAVEVEVRLVAVATCPKCGKRLEVQRKLHEEQLTTGNTTQAAVYHVREMRSMIEADKAQRGWTSSMCGACRDDGPVRAREVKIDGPAKTHGGDDDWTTPPLLLALCVALVACGTYDGRTDAVLPDQCEGSPWTDPKRPWIACWRPSDGGPDDVVTQFDDSEREERRTR